MSSTGSLSFSLATLHLRSSTTSAVVRQKKSASIEYRAKRKWDHLRNSPAEKTNSNHKEPIRDGSNPKQETSNHEIELVLGEKPIGGMEHTIVGTLLIPFLRIECVKSLGGDGR